MALYTVTDTELTSIADAIRSKTGTSTSMVYPGEFAERLQHVPTTYIDTGALDILLSQTSAIPCEFTATRIGTKMFIMKPWTGVSMPNCVSVGSSAFRYCSNLSYVFMPQCEYIDSMAFQFCSSLSAVSLPKCKSLGGNVFGECSMLPSISLPLCKGIPDGAFYKCFSLFYVSVPECEYIGANAFYSCSALSEASFPQCLEIGSSAFVSCVNLTNVSIPECLSIWSYAFINCTSLSSVYMPKIKQIGSYAFNRTDIRELILSDCSYISQGAFGSCSMLSVVSVSGLSTYTYLSSAFSNCTSLTDVYLNGSNYTVGKSAFYSCTALQTVILHNCSSIDSGAFIKSLYGTSPSIQSLYLYGSKMVTLGSYASSVFKPYPEAIYVPSSLYASYMANYSWRSVSSLFVSITE